MMTCQNCNPINNDERIYFAIFDKKQIYQLFWVGLQQILNIGILQMIFAQGLKSCKTIKSFE